MQGLLSKKLGKLIFFANFLVIYFTAISFIGYRLFFSNSKEIKRLALLPVPEVISDSFYPGPLRMPLFYGDVLGYEKIYPEDIVKYINIERAKTGAKPLKINPVLTQAAKMRADVILKYQNFSHQDPHEGIELITSLKKLGYHYSYASENIGMGGVSAENFVFGFMHSTSHRENLLNPALEETGVAVVTGPYEKWYVNIAVQMFAQPAEKEVYLGYTEEDIEYYEDLLENIDNQLTRSYDLYRQGAGGSEYYSGWINLLVRQKEIVSTLYARMTREEPWYSEHVDLVHEYNLNWSKAPKS